MAMAEAWFFVPLTIFVLIWKYVLDHCPAGRSNDDLVLVSWQRQPDSNDMTGKAFFLACLPNNLLAWRWRLIVVLETWCYFPPTVILGGGGGGGVCLSYHSRHCACHDMRITVLIRGSICFLSAFCLFILVLFLVSLAWSLLHVHLCLLFVMSSHCYVLFCYILFFY